MIAQVSRMLNVLVVAIGSSAITLMSIKERPNIPMIVSTGALLSLSAVSLLDIKHQKLRFFLVLSLATVVICSNLFVLR